MIDRGSTLRSSDPATGLSNVISMVEARPAISAGVARSTLRGVGGAAK
jgi:hypothetical protein